MQETRNDYLQDKALKTIFKVLIVLLLLFVVLILIIELNIRNGNPYHPDIARRNDSVIMVNPTPDTIPK